MRPRFLTVGIGLAVVTFVLFLACGRAPAQPPVEGQWPLNLQHPSSWPIPPGLSSSCNQDSTRFNAIHAALIARPTTPTGPYPNLQGWVFLMGKAKLSGSGVAYVPFAVFNPRSGQSFNFCAPMPGSNQKGQQAPVESGDVFCSGHAWTERGELIIAGGTLYHANGSDFDGSKLLYFWRPDRIADPDHGFKRANRDLAQARYYPTVTRLPGNRFAVFGGMERYDPATGSRIIPSTYEVFTVSYDVSGNPTVTRDANQAQQSIYAGPSIPSSVPGILAELYWYPHVYLMSDGYFFMSGFSQTGARALHDPNVLNTPWSTNAGQWRHPQFGIIVGLYAHYLASTLDPLRLNTFNPLMDRVTRWGGVQTLGPGEPSDGAPASSVVERCNGKPPPGGTTEWAPSPTAMNNPRFAPSAVTLFNGSTLLLGGTSDRRLQGGSTYNLDAEIWKDHTRIAVTPAMPSKRAYHATGLSLADGAVLTSGGNTRDWDHSVYEPRYFQLGYRPLITSLSSTRLGVGTTTLYRLYYDVQTPTGDADPVEKVILLRPGSVTHHFDMDARCIELQQGPMPDPPPPGTFVDFLAPPNENIAPKGWYMLVIVTYGGAASVAAWVELA